MRWLALLVLTTSCGGGAAATEQGPSKTAAGESDPGFTDYAASQGIATLNGGGGDAPEVTADGLRLEALDKDKPVKLDGVPTEWPPFAKAGTVIKGAGKAGMMIGLQYDDAKLYVGAVIKAGSFAVGRDHVSLVLAVPTPGGTYASYELGIYAGKPGESEGSVRYGGKGSVPGAKIVEAPEAGGYTLEAVIPWSALPEAQSTRVGIHGVARYVTGDDEIATGPVNLQRPASMAWIPSEPELSMIEQFLAPKGLTKASPTFDAVADLTGDGVRERIAVFEHYLTICGSSYLGGTGFFFRDLGGELVRLDVRDATGRGKGDVIVRRRASVGDGSREYLEVLSAMSNARRAARDLRARDRGPAVGQAHRQRRAPLARHDRGERRAGDELGRALVPGADRERRRADPLSVGRRAVADVALGRLALRQGEGGRAEGADPRRRRRSTIRPRTPPSRRRPRSPRAATSPSQMLDQYRRDRGVGGDAAPKSDLRVQVTGDARPERVVLIGRDIVVFGPGFKGGTGYAT